MDLEKLKEILGIDDEEKLKAIFDAINGEIQGLVKTKDTLREELKELRKKQKKFESVDLEEIEAMREELEQLRDGADADDDDEANKGKGPKAKSRQELQALVERETRKLREEIEKRDSRITALMSSRDQALVEREINHAVEALEATLDKEGKKLTPAGKRYLNEVMRFRAQVVEEDDEASVVFPSSDGISLPPSEYLQDWSRSDVAKDFIAAPRNSGGGAGGGGSASGDKKPEDYTEQERLALFKSDPNRFRELFGGS